MGHTEAPGRVSGRKLVTIFIVIGVIFLSVWALLAVTVFSKQAVTPGPNIKTGPEQSGSK